MMNRIRLNEELRQQARLQADLVTQQQAAEVIFGRVTSEDATGGHSLFTPLHYERHYAYPLLVWLHGPHDNQRQLLRVIPQISMRNYVAIAPCGPAAAAGNGCGYDWSEEDPHDAVAMQRIADAIHLARSRCHIAVQRIFLAGYRSGGTMALRFAFRHPDFIAGAVSLAGSLPQGRTPFSRIRQLREVPLLLSVCRESTHFSPQAASENLRLMHAAGMQVDLREYAGVDGLTPAMLKDVDRWLMQRINAH